MLRTVQKKTLSVGVKGVGVVSARGEGDGNDIVSSSSARAAKGKNSIVLGNWFPSSVAAGNKNNDDGSSPPSVLYDTILADYLIGAMDGFSPYEQDLMIPRLARYLKPGGLLHIVGMEPVPDYSDGGDSDGDINEQIIENLIGEVRRVRDACILLAGDRPYREYPLSWIRRQIANMKTVQDGLELELVDLRRFPIRHSYRSLKVQIDVGRSKLQKVDSKNKKSLMKSALNDLDARVKRAFDKLSSSTSTSTGKNSGNSGKSTKRSVVYGFDYLVTVRRKEESETADTSSSSTRKGPNSNHMAEESELAQPRGGRKILTWNHST